MQRLAISARLAYLKILSFQWQYNIRLGKDMQRLAISARVAYFWILSHRWHYNIRLGKDMWILAIFARLVYFKILVRIANMGFLIWVFCYWQSLVSISGFFSICSFVMVYLDLFFFFTFADVVVRLSSHSSGQTTFLTVMTGITE